MFICVFGIVPPIVLFIQTRGIIAIYQLNSDWLKYVLYHQQISLDTREFCAILESISYLRFRKHGRLGRFQDLALHCDSQVRGHNGKATKSIFRNF